MNLTNKVALITGGSSGIGRATAKALAEVGARVSITGRDKSKLEETARALGVHAIHADVAIEADVHRTYRELTAKFGDLDILVNNAGVGSFKPLIDTDTAVFERVLATNVTGLMMMGREAAKIFIKRNGGNIVNISSTAGLRGAPNGTAYYSSKFAVRGMTECWRAELRKHNIRVMLVNPSEVLTNFSAANGLGTKKINDCKLRAEEIAYGIKATQEKDDRCFIPELSVFATNPSRLAGGCDLNSLPLRFEFTARESLFFPQGKAANTLRGAFGEVFRRTAPSTEYPRVFAPVATTGPSGFSDSPRARSYSRARHLDGRNIQSGQPFYFDLNVFSPADPALLP